MRPTISGLRLNLDSAYTAFIRGGSGSDVVLAITNKYAGAGDGGSRGRGAPRGGRGGAPAQPQPADSSSVRFDERDITQLRQKLRGAYFTVKHGCVTSYADCRGTL